MTSVLDRIERGEVFIAVGGIEESQNIPFFKELIRLARIGEKMQWVDSAYRLPEYYVPVILCTDTLQLATLGRVLIRNYGLIPCWFKYPATSNRGDNYDAGVTINYTHWMPLPEPPKEVK